MSIRQLQIITSTFFVKGVVSGFDCTTDPMTNQRFLDSQPDIECVVGGIDEPTEYSEIRALALYGLGGWVFTFGVICVLFLTKGGKQRFDFLTGKMEDSWYWWELWLLVRKVSRTLFVCLPVVASTTPAH